MERHEETWTGAGFGGDGPARPEGAPTGGGDADAVTLADVLGLEPLRDVKVLAGHRSLHRPVRLVNVIEVPDIVDWVLEGELLLTTGFTFRDDPAHLAALIPGLAAKGAAGLGIKPKRYMAEIPPEAVAAADRCGLPLLEIPFHLSFSEVIGPVMQAIAHRQAAATLAADRLQRDLLDQVLRGAGLDELCTTIARHLGRAVWIEDAAGAVVAQSIPTADATGPAEPAGPAWRVPIASGTRFFGSLCAKSPGRAPLPVEAGLLERGAAILALEWGKQEAVIEVQRRYRKEFLDRLLAGELPHPDEVRERARALGWNLDRPQTVVAFAPVTPGVRPAPGASPALAGPAGTAAAGLGAGPASEPRALQALLRAVEMVLSMEGGEPVVGIREGVVVALVPGDPADPAGRHRILTVAKAVLRSFASSAGVPRGPHTGVGTKPAARGGVAPQPGPAGSRRTTAVRAPADGPCVPAGSSAREGPPATAAVAGVGRVARHPGELARSFREARTALHAARAVVAPAAGGGMTGRAGFAVTVAGETGAPAVASPPSQAAAAGRPQPGTPASAAGPGPAPGRSRPAAGGPLPRREPVQFFADLGVLRLLHHQPPEELAGFVADYLGPLLEYDRRHDGKLVETLAALFRYGGNMKRMARALYTHYNTVAYRLQRIRQITGLDLKNPDHLLSLQVALEALPLLEMIRPWAASPAGPGLPPAAPAASGPAGSPGDAPPCGPAVPSSSR